MKLGTQHSMIQHAEKEVVTDRFIQSLCIRLSENKRVRRKLPIWGRVHIDRKLPFLCVYRKPSDRDDPGTEKLLFGEAAYVIASGESYLRDSLKSLVQSIAKTQVAEFGRMLIVEIWSSLGNTKHEVSREIKPAFRIHMQSDVEMEAVVGRLQASLKSTKVHGQSADVSIASSISASADGYRPLVGRSELKEQSVAWIGLEVKPIYRVPESREVFPLILRTLHRSVSRSLKQTFFEFSKAHTNHKAPHFLALGRRAVVKAVWDVDNKLADVSNSFSLLLTVSPTNADSAFSLFKRSRYEKAPDFTYPPIPVDTSILKRNLHKIPIERIEDPVLSRIFREQQDDLDRRLTLLSDRSSRRFLYGSMQLFGGVQNWILNVALGLLSSFPPRSRDESKSGYLSAEEFAKYANEEIDYYRAHYDGFSASCQVREDISGLIVSKGRLLIGTRSKIPRARAKALVQHEIGTHLLTYFNGKAQPLKQLYVGLAGYDELQEGLAVLSEYFVDGLTRTRMRLLAARVVAVRRLIEGATFVDTFRELNSAFGLEKRVAFSITMRVFRGGGLTKDATYLKGLLRVTNYLASGGDLETLFIGKFNTDHVPLIKELKYRRILQPAPLLPRYISEAQTQAKLAKLKNNLTLSELVGSAKGRRADK